MLNRLKQNVFKIRLAALALLILIPVALYGAAEAGWSAGILALLALLAVVNALLAWLK